MVVRYHVNDIELSRQFHDLTGRWGRAVAGKAYQRAIATAPRGNGWRSENLAAQHKINPGGWRGPYGRTFNISNSASYAKFVHEGTAGNGKGFIEHEYMVFPGSELTNPPVRRFRVRIPRVKGQKAKPWLARAMAAALQAEGIRGATFTRMR